MIGVNTMRQKLLRESVNKSLRLCLSAVIILFCFFASQAQSINQSFPTAVTTNEINGKIPARDIGDARLTNYFYVFNGNQGDVFINVVTKNFDGDIDVFTLNGLRPLTKITMYSDSSDNETGRIVYLRQPEKLLLRIEGRSPNDDPATFRIKFAGSFEPIRNVAENEQEELPEVKTEEGEVRVNSVGTIIEKKPKPTPVKETVAEKEEVKSDTVAEKKEDKKVEKSDKKETVAEKKDDEIAKKEEEKKEEKKEEESDKAKVKTKERPKPVVVITDNLPPKPDEKKVEKTEDETASKTEAETKKEKKPKKPDPLENINLIVLFKDGTKIERPISEVVRVSVDKGILTIITKDGLISRYSILDVAEMTIK
jgi:hypothetical protein